mgnify:CR=1 FL=1
MDLLFALGYRRGLEARVQNRVNVCHSVTTIVQALWLPSYNDRTNPSGESVVRRERFLGADRGTEREREGKGNVAPTSED